MKLANTVGNWAFIVGVASLIGMAVTSIWSGYTSMGPWWYVAASCAAASWIVFAACIIVFAATSASGEK